MCISIENFRPKSIADILAIVFARLLVILTSILNKYWQAIKYQHIVIVNTSVHVLCAACLMSLLMISVLLQNKMKSKKIAELESSVAQLKSGSCADVASDKVMKVAARRVMPPGHDEYNKACQTVETAFVPCEGCYLVQQSLREAGRTLVKTCDTLSLTSHLARYQATVTGLDWLSGIY